MSKFAATYYINKYTDGTDGDFAFELLDLHVMFDNIYEEQGIIGEYSDTYEEVTFFLLKDHPEGYYSVFVLGDTVYTTDYYGEADCDVELFYHKVRELPEDYIESDLQLEVDE